MRFYETMFILKPTLTQEEIDAKIEFFKKILQENSASIEGCINMGMRNLAYEIKKAKRGYYYVIYFKAPPTLVAELERNYRISEDVLRFIVINYKNKREQTTWQTLVDRANGKIEPKKEKLKKDESEAREDSDADLSADEGADSNLDSNADSRKDDSSAQ